LLGSCAVKVVTQVVGASDMCIPHAGVQRFLADLNETYVDEDTASSLSVDNPGVELTRMCAASPHLLLC
jgi:Fe-S cluster assembly iron-binding protein IscA